MMIRHVLTAVLPLALLLNQAVCAQEDPLLTLVRVLRDNGTINQQAYATMAEAIRQRGQAMAAKTARKAAVPETHINTKGKLEISSSDGGFKVRVGGRVQADYNAFDSDRAKLGNGSEIRRGRLFVSGTMWRAWQYKFQYDFTSTGIKGIKDAYIRYRGPGPGVTTVGHFKEPYSLENMTSSKYTMFIERSLPAAFLPGRSIGLAYAAHGGNWSASGGVFGKGVDDTGANDEGYAASGRVTWAPLHSKENTLHLGLAASHRDTGSLNSLRLKTRPEAHAAAVSLVDSGNLDVSSFNRYGLEAAWLHGPFTLQSEYMRLGLNRKLPGGSDLDFDGWYVEGSWFLTGESRNYQAGKGAYSKITPKGIVGQGGMGAWELGLRFSSIDLSDADVTGGEEQNLTVGLNWYTTPNIRFMANYVDVLNLDGGKHAGDQPAAFLLRGQIEF